MCLQVIVELCGNAITIMLFSFLGFIALIYFIGIIISLFGLIMWCALLLMNPTLYVFIIALILGGLLLLAK